MFSSGLVAPVNDFVMWSSMDPIGRCGTAFTCSRLGGPNDTTTYNAWDLDLALGDSWYLMFR